MPRGGRPALAAILYGLGLAVLLAAPLNPRDHMTHGVLRIERYGSTRRMVKDVVQNVLAFAPFGFLLRRAVRRSVSGAHAASVAAVMTATAFAITMEAIQSTIPGRYSSLIDVALDGVGAALGTGLEAGFSARRRPSPRRSEDRRGAAPPPVDIDRPSCQRVAAGGDRRR
jgi:VanZ family protein